MEFSSETSSMPLQLLDNNYTKNISIHRMNQMYFYIHFIQFGRYNSFTKKTLDFNQLILNTVNQCWAREARATA